MANVKLGTIGNIGEFMAGLLFNVVQLQWWILKPAMEAQGIDLNHPEAKRLCATSVVDLVLARFGDSTAAEDLRGAKEQLVAMLVEAMGNPQLTPHLKLVD